jgi:purine-nucleoside phosphorylase
MEEKGIYDKAVEAADFCFKQVSFKPEIGLILGSGLGEFADSLENKIAIAFEDIPHFKKSTVVGHAGKLVFG